MAIPPNAATYAQQQKITGIALSVAPSTDQSLDTEIWARTSSGTSALFQTLSGLNSNSQMVTVVHRLPLDNRKRFYKFRTVGAGYWPSAFSTEITAKPTLLSPSIITTPVSGRGIAVPFLFSNASVGSTSSTGLPSASYGTSAVRSSLVKYVTAGAVTFRSTTDTAGLGTYDNFGRFTNTKADSTSYVFQGWMFVPGGCTLTVFASALFLNNAGGSVAASLYELDGDPAARTRTLLKTNTGAGTTGWVNYLGLPFSHLVPLPTWFLVEVTVNNGGVASRTGFGDCTLTYTTPTDANTY